MIKHSYKKITQCRLCKSKNIHEIYSYNDSPLCDEFLSKKNKQFFYPLALQKCQKCNFVQINTVVEPKKIYDNYLYLSKSSNGLSDHFKKYSTQIQKKLKLGKNTKVIDIGSNDGVLLKHFKKSGYSVYGIEPFMEASHEANKNGIFTINSYFDNELIESFLKIIGKVELICINNLFANVDNLDDFITNCLKILKDEGYLVIESSYLFDMLKKNIFDFVYHEHLSYFSILPLRKYLNKFDLHIIDLQKSNSKGGSLRYIFKKTTKKINIDNKINNLIKFEFQNYKDFNYIMSSYTKNIADLRYKFDKFFQVNKNKKISVFGASATSTTFLSEIQIGKKFDYFIDENPNKIGRFSPGYAIKVISLKDIRKYKIDIVVILAWRFAPIIIKKIKKYKVSYLVPIPNFKLYDSPK